MSVVVEVMLAKSLIACILIRKSLRSCKAIDLILDLHYFSPFNLCTCLGAIHGGCMSAYTDTDYDNNCNLQ